VFSYSTTATTPDGHGDWRYDEFTVDDAGRLVHEIEWATWRETGVWRIVASDIQFTWIPLATAETGSADP
jgi:hypothetical protein